MSRKKPPKKNEDIIPSGLPQGGVLITLKVIQFFTTIVERFGWPGAVLFVTIPVIQFWSTSEQRSQIIDKYVLGNGMHAWWPLALPAIFFIILLWAQGYYYRRLRREDKEEMRRIADEKSRLQEKLTQRELKHVSSGKLPEGD